MKRAARLLLLVLLSYLIAGVACVLYVLWPNYSGHAHVPFSGFPGFLVWSPAIPFLLLADLLSGETRDAFGLVVFTVAFAASLWAMVRKKI